MSRRWTDLVAAVSDVIPLPLLLFAMIILALIAGALWYFFPAWVPRRLPRLRRPRWRWRWQWRWRWRLRWPRFRWSLRWPWRRRRVTDEPAVEAPVTADDALPALPADALASLADRLAAQGRYAEAIRERLRAMVRHLVERGVIDDRPGWTVTELSAAAGLAPLGEAAMVFSDVWYAQRPATAELDARMRELAQQIRLNRATTMVGGR